MPITFIIFYFVYALYWATIFHSLKNRKKISDEIFSAVFLLCLASMIPDTWNLYNVLNSIPSSLPSDIYSLLIPVVFYYIYHTNKIVSQFNKLTGLLMLIHVALGTITIFNLVDLGSLKGLLDFSSNIFGIVFPLYHFYQLFRNLNVPNLMQNAMFWVSTALIWYNGSTIFLEILKPIIEDEGLYYQLWPFYQIILIGYMLSLNYGIHVASKYRDNLKSN